MDAFGNQDYNNFEYIEMEVYDAEDENKMLQNDFFDEGSLNYNDESGQCSSSKLINNVQKKKKKPAKNKSGNEFNDEAGMQLTLYAYKDDLGKYDSLVNNLSIKLWRREENSILFQRFNRLNSTVNEEPLFVSTLIYSCWEKERANQYLEIIAIVEKTVVIDGYTQILIKILNLDEIEYVCTVANFKSLNLEPYLSNADRRKNNEILADVNHESINSSSHLEYLTEYKEEAEELNDMIDSNNMVYIHVDEDYIEENEENDE